MKKLSGFTLIELLIVVLIIAILAAIAVPNFLEFQMRAKVSRAKSDLRTMATAIEAYCVDNDTYPSDSDDKLPANQKGLVYLTTPVAFLSSLSLDPFGQGAGDTSHLYYELGSGVDNGAATKSQAWLLFSGGPANANPAENDDTNGNDNWPYNCSCLTYDPTNGSVSTGDIYRVGGEYKRGDYTVNGERQGEFPQ